MANLTEAEKSTLYRNMQVINGVKYFGQLDHAVSNDEKTTEKTITPGKPDLSVVIAVMDRPERLIETIGRISASVSNAKRPTEIVVVDNSLDDNIYQKLMDVNNNGLFTSDTLIKFIYHYDPRLIIPTAWNTGTQKLSTNSKYIAIWDSDIYCAPHTFGNLLNTLDSTSDLAGIAPPLGSYQTGLIDESIDYYKDIEGDDKKRQGLHMPGAIGETIGKKRDPNILRTGLMRGAYIVRRSLVDQISADMPENDAWSRDFVCWQNVPFFLQAREAGNDFGYLMSGDNIVLHDDRVDSVSLGFRLPLRTTETLKDICQIMVRNQVFTTTNKEVHARFLQFNLSEIMRVTDLDNEKAVAIQQKLLDLAQAFSEDSVKSFIEDNKADDTITKVASKLQHPDVKKRVKQLHSLAPERPIYSI